MARMLIAFQLPCMALGAEDAGYRPWRNANLQKRVFACVAAGRAANDGTKDRLCTGGRGRVSAVHQPEAAGKPPMTMRASPSELR